MAVVQGNEHVPLRAFGALSFEEEKHAILGRAHLVLAAERRTRELAFKGGRDQQFLEAMKALGTLRRELDKSLQERATDEVLADRETMLVVISTDGRRFDRCSPELRADPEVALAAFLNCPWTLRHASEALRGDKDMMLKVVQINGLGLEYASTQLRGDKAVVLAALASNPWALDFASDALKADREVVMAALRRQTFEDVLDNDDNILRFASEDLLEDKEIVLEAVRSDGAAFGRASTKLKKDKDFLLQAVRRAGDQDEAKSCYEEADESVKVLASWAQCWGAANSVLAVPGDHAPVLTVALHSQHDFGQTCTADSPHTITADATLLSGVCFTCSVPADSAEADTPNTADPHSSSGGTKEEEEEKQPAQKRPKLADSEPSARNSKPPPPTTVAQFAKVLLEELPKHAKAKPSPELIFVVFEAADQSSPANAATPWDWDRPLRDFLR